MEKEKRKFVRYPVEISSHINASEINGAVKDISAGGFSVQTAIDLEKESNVYMIFLLDNDNISCEGRIKVKIEKEGTFKYGIAFFQNYHKVCLELVENREKIQIVEIES